jgi:hypothetical protein
MAIDILNSSAPLDMASASNTSDRRGIGRWSALAFPLLAAAGAATVIAGSYATWATFYAGLISRNGVDGHGKYFIGLAAASVLAALLSTRRGVSRAVTLLIIPAGITIAVMALRDIRNFDAFVHDPASGFYVPAMGNGLYIVLAGAALMIISVFAQNGAPSLRPFQVKPTLAALAAVSGVAALVSGLYGEYYLHIAHGHVHGHTDVLNTPHLLTAGGVLALVAATRIVLSSMPRATTRRR